MGRGVDEGGVQKTKAIVYRPPALAIIVRRSVADGGGGMYCVDRNHRAFNARDDAGSGVAGVAARASGLKVSADDS